MKSILRCGKNISSFGVMFAILAMPKPAWSATYPLDAENWKVEGQEVEFVNYRGKNALRLKGGSAVLQGVTLLDGIMEFDIAVSAQRAFSGARFRVADDTNFEHFYIRPHQSGNPDANQYTPVFDGVSSWQLYYGDGYAAPVTYRVDDWMHIKIVFQGSRAEIYIDSDEPSLLVRELKRAAHEGLLGLDASPLASAYFANVTVSDLPGDYTFTEPPVVKVPVPETVLSWQVSDAFVRAELEQMNVLSSDFKAARRWTPLDAEATGITNFARLQGLVEERDTVIGKLTIRSTEEQLKGISFGYSDDVAVYVNGSRIYGGSNRYESRDYRYLGTIGLFDKVYLPLRAGQNEVWFAVSEAFGGWGIQAQLDDLDGITLINN